MRYRAAHMNAVTEASGLSERLHDLHSGFAYERRGACKTSDGSSAAGLGILFVLGEWPRVRGVALLTLNGVEWLGISLLL